MREIRMLRFFPRILSSSADYLLMVAKTTQFCGGCLHMTEGEHPEDGYNLSCSSLQMNESSEVTDCDICQNAYIEL